MTQRHPRDSAPVTLVLTVLNEATGLPALLASVEGQTVIPREIVIVDGGSTDGTTDIVTAWKITSGLNVRLVREVGSSISEGRNRGIELATSDHVAITDGGVTLDAGWLQHLVHAAAGSSNVVASGFFRPVGTGIRERAIAFTTTPTLDEVDPLEFLPSSRSILFSKDAWATVGGYPTWLDYCEDLIFDLRLKDAGFLFVFVPSAQVTWSARATWTTFFRQYYRYSRGDGKAGLWTSRHVIRYTAYLWWALASVSGKRPAHVAATLTAAVYLAPKLRRTLRHADSQACSPTYVLLTPWTVVVGDVAKMWGYPAGLWWRILNRPPPWR